MEKFILGAVIALIGTEAYSLFLTRKANVLEAKIQGEAARVKRLHFITPPYTDPGTQEA